MSAIRPIPDDFFECQHGYLHYSDCPLCGRFDSAIVEAVDQFVATMPEDPSLQDMVLLAEFLQHQGAPPDDEPDTDADLARFQATHRVSWDDEDKPYYAI